MNTPQIDFTKLNGLVPCIVQDHRTKTVLMLGFMNEEAYTKTREEKKITFYSRSKQRLWTKGETSGNYFEVIELLVDCDQDSILARVNPKGPACHTGADTCFNEDNEPSWSIHTLEAVIHKRKQNPSENSYTNSLLDAGINKVAQKVGEEAVELVIESKDDNKDLFLGEAADLMYHYLVLLTAKGYTLNEVEQVLSSRHNKK